MTKLSFTRSVAVLAGGSAFGQILMIVALPFLTRLYTPNDFSVLAVFSAILAVLSIVSTLRLDIAIPVAKNDKDAVILTVLALLSVFVFSLLISLSIVCFSERISTHPKLSLLSPYLWLVPIGVFLTGGYNTLQFWISRHKGFALISRTRITQTIAAVAVQVTAGMYGITPLGLLLGYIFSVGGGFFVLLKHIIQFHNRIFSNLTFKQLKYTLYQYRKYPQYSTFEALANNTAIQLPMIIIAFYGVGSEAGYLLLAMRVMQAPLTVVGSAIAQVYMSHASEEYKKGNLSTFTADVIGRLTKIGVGPLIFAGILAPIIFPIVFGEVWSRAGILVSWMVPWFVFQFLSSPISMSLHILEHQSLALWLQVFGVLLRVGSLVLAIMYYDNMASEFYIASGAIFYILYFIVVIKVTAVKIVDALNALKASLAYVFGWVFGGWFFVLVLRAFSGNIGDFLVEALGLIKSFL
ncbi:MAG: oligosaccharide flippase family protein [Agitococcus sp.]|nr:oligosaccharide flippase family protein [Agitococcus sp.]